jgi:hypothetical protein
MKNTKPQAGVFCLQVAALHLQALQWPRMALALSWLVSQQRNHRAAE